MTLMVSDISTVRDCTSYVRQILVLNRHLRLHETFILLFTIPIFKLEKETSDRFIDFIQIYRNINESNQSDGASH